MPQRFRHLQMDTTRAYEKKTLATAEAVLERVPKASKEQDAKYKDSTHGRYSSKTSASDLRRNADCAHLEQLHHHIEPNRGATRSKNRRG